MRRPLSLLAAGALALALPLLADTSAEAASGDKITRFDVLARVGDDGSVRVVETIDDYFAKPGHGPYVYFTTRQSYDSLHDRLYGYSDISVTSPTGAPVDVEQSHTTTYVQLRIGDPDQKVSGTQTYVISYTMTGALNPRVEESGLDELYWNVIGTGWTLPISNVTVTVESAHDVVKTACYYGHAYTTACASHSSSGGTATFAQPSLEAGNGLAIATGWPAGTFADAHPTIVEVDATQWSVAGGSIYGVLASALAALAAGLGVFAVSKAGRDIQYASAAPSLAPETGPGAATKREDVADGPVTATPPPGIPPRLLGALIRERVANEDVTSTIVDLCVRGYLHLRQGEEVDDFALQRAKRDPGDLNQVDRRVYDLLLGNTSAIGRQRIASESFYPSFKLMRKAIEDEFNAQRWYKGAPKSVVRMYRVLGVVIAVIGGAIAAEIGKGVTTWLRLAGLNVGGFGYLWVACAVFGVGLFLLAPRLPVRTPAGSAVAVQAFGFKKYLESTQADQLNSQDGRDVFSQYLPYAVSFGCADHWAKVFEEAVQAGRPTSSPNWYTGRNLLATGLGLGAVTFAVSNIESSFADSTMAHAQAMSSGGSGFSGGGDGGGVGGGGGGNW
ncbi:MAG: DUF2207 domain-containing protein [Propionibacteriaceae bacterium]|jgi:hypothetical protein|nr:DUF2207 domain-containing protein [Propionibacteriaceae bacterium]